MDGDLPAQLGATVIAARTLPSADPAPPMRWCWTRRDLALGLLLVALGVLARGLTLGPGLVRLDDPDGYLRLARSLVAGDGLRINGKLTAYRPPLYPILLAPWVRLGDGPGLGGWLAGFHLGLGAATVALVGDSARRWGLGRPACLLAAAVAALDPVLLVQVRALMTETLAACLVALALWGAALGGARGPVAAGLGLGLAALCRPSLLPAAFLAAGGGLLLDPGRPADRLARALTLMVATLAVVLPWVIRNALLFGEPVWTTTHGGYTLALANNPAYYGDVVHGPPGAVWSGPNQVAWIRSINAATAGLPEPAADRLLRREAIACARERPGDFGRATLARLGRFWGVMPAAAVYPARLRWAVAAWTIPLWGLALLGVARPEAWRGARSLAPALVLTLTAIHSVYWTDLRMRAPLVSALALLAAAGFSARESPRSSRRETA